ncbi:hypothetical protein [Mesoplasma seiffertii]|uniref:hypothetical protein n=1 Tax=Mesoplasma seiffertii TaxID=28224 RepID=UPI00047E358F|nr:hypothetical protein [Mesoplasma seiffertii]
MSKMEKMFRTPNLKLTKLEFLNLLRLRMLKDLLITSIVVGAITFFIILIELVILQKSKVSILSYRTVEIIGSIIAVFGCLRLLATIKKYLILIKSRRQTENWNQLSKIDKFWVYLNVLKISQSYFSRKTLESFEVEHDRLSLDINYDENKSYKFENIGISRRPSLFRMLRWIIWWFGELFSWILIAIFAVMVFLPNIVTYFNSLLNIFRIEDTVEVNENYKNILLQFWPE